MIPSLLSQARGIAVFDDGERLGLLDVRQPGEVIQFDELSLARVLHKVPDLERLEVTDTPALARHLIIRRNREELLQHLLIALDEQCSTELRSKAVESLATRREDPEWAWLEGVVASAPLSELMSLKNTSAIDGPLSVFFQRLRELQGPIQLLARAWRSLPAECFQNESRDEALARVVRAGVFRNLLLGSTGSRLNPFSGALRSYSRALHLATSSGPENFWHAPALHKVNVSHRVWAASPWRSSWIASDWERSTCLLASEAGRQFVSSSPSRTVAQGPSSEVVFDRIANLWDETRHRSVLASSVDLIWILALSKSPNEETSVSKMQEFHAREQRYLVSLKRRLPSHLRSDSGAESQLHGLIVAFFDARETANELALNPEFKHLCRMENGGTWNSLVERAHSEWYEKAPLGTESLRAFLKAPTELANYPLEPLRQAISLFTLDRIFLDEGCLVHISSAESFPRDQTRARVASLLNLSNRRRQTFDGYLAWIIAQLRDRLMDDLRSGLPHEHCGWAGLAELGSSSGRSENAVADELETVRRRAQAAGFAAATFQQRHHEVRLNPEFATPTA